MVRGRRGANLTSEHRRDCVTDCMLTLTDARAFVLQCSKSCGGGTRRRGAVCRKAAEADGDESKCSQRDKLTSQPCNEFLCPQWKTGDWSEVSSATEGNRSHICRPDLSFHIQEVGSLRGKCVSFLF